MVFVRAKTFHRASGPLTYYYLVHNYWRDGRIRQKVIAYLGRVPPSGANLDLVKDIVSEELAKLDGAMPGPEECHRIKAAVAAGLILELRRRRLAEAGGPDDEGGGWSRDGNGGDAGRVYGEGDGEDDGEDGVWISGV